MSSARPGRPPASLLLKDLAGLATYYPGGFLVSRLPRGLQDLLAALGGDIRRRLGPQEVAVATEELRLLFGEAPMPASERTIIRDAWRTDMYNELDVLRYPSLDPDRIDDVCEIEGREHLDAALDRGRGAVVLIGHFGANQMIMPALGYKGYPMNQLSAPPPVWGEILRETRTTPLWERVLARRWELEKRLPVRHINVFRFLRPAFECLRRNEVLGLAFDGGGGRRWTSVRLLARRARVSVQPMDLVRRTGAALLPTRVIREPGERRHRISIGSPLPYRPGGGREAEMQRNMQAFADIFGRWVARNPEQYLGFLLLRRRVRGSDVMPFFDDYPPAPEGIGPAEARERLRRAGGWREPPGRAQPPAIT